MSTPLPARKTILPGSPPDTRPLRKCDKCERMHEQAGGTHVGSQRWWCSHCWTVNLFKARRGKKT